MKRTVLALKDSSNSEARGARAHRAHDDHALLETATLTGAASGAIAGAIAGPPGAVVGGVLGLAAGMLAGDALEKAEDGARVHERSLEVGPIESFMTEQRVDLERLLGSARRADGTIDDAAYERFRDGLLRHIAMEEEILLPFARLKQGAPLALAERLRAGHRALAKLLVRLPSPAIIAALEAILGQHDELEEGPRGLYASCDALAWDEAVQVVETLRSQPEVPQSRYYDEPLRGRSY